MRGAIACVSGPLRGTFCFLIAADAVAAVLRTMTADSVNIVLIDISVSWSVRGSSLLCLPSKHRPPATIPSIMSHQPRINAGKRWPVLAGAAAQPTA